MRIKDSELKPPSDVAISQDTKLEALRLWLIRNRDTSPEASAESIPGCFGSSLLNALLWACWTSPLACWSWSHHGWAISNWDMSLSKTWQEPFRETEKRQIKKLSNVKINRYVSPHVTWIVTVCSTIGNSIFPAPPSWPPQLFEGQGCFAGREAAKFAASDWALQQLYIAAETWRKTGDLDDLLTYTFFLEDMTIMILKQVSALFFW